MVISEAFSTACKATGSNPVCPRRQRARRN